MNGAPASWVLLARLVRPQGRKGEVLADLFTDFPERFASRPRVFLAPSQKLPSAQAPSRATPREITIERHWLHQGRVVLKFAGIESINDAEALRGLDVVIPAEERAPLDGDAVYIGDLIGCRVIDLAAGEDAVLGEIEDVERGQGGAPDLLVVRPAKPPALDAATKPKSQKRGKRAKKLPELLIPFAKKYLVAVDIPAKTVTMQLPAGLTELNAVPPSPEDDVTEDSTALDTHGTTDKM